MPPREPFKFLDAYTKEDAEIFFGREAEIEELYNRVFSTNHLLMYGQSGTGKTSLIQCGLANRFEESDWLPIFIRYGENIFASLDHEIAKLAVTPVPSAHPLDKTLQSLYLDYFKPIYLIFDQFEELFILGSPDERDHLAQELFALLDVSFELKMIFVLREEYLAEMTALEQYHPDLFANRFRVEHMGRSGLLRAIEGPCNICGIDIDKELPERILNQLGLGQAGTVELTYLQVLLDKLYARSQVRREGRSGAESRPEQETREAETALHSVTCLTTNDLDALGTIEDILGTFLDEQLAAMEEAQAALGEAVLKTLITPDGTKRTMGREEIVAALASMGRPADPEQVTAVLTRFVTVRILSEKEESGQYELRHDSLAQKIFERMTALEKDLLEVMQTVENRYKEYQTRGTFLDPAALEYVAPYESRLKFKPYIAEFIRASRQEFTRVRRKRRAIFFASLLVVFMVVSGLGIVSYLSYLSSEQQRKIAVSLQQEAEEQRKIAEAQTEIAQQHLQQSQLNEIEALIQTSKALFLSHDELGGLLAGVKAGIMTTRTKVSEITKFQTILNLRELLGSVQEKNRLERQEMVFVTAEQQRRRAVVTVAFSPDGTRFASGNADGMITFWNGADGRELLTFQGHLRRVVNSMSFSPDSTLLASVGFGERFITLWNVADGSKVTRLKGARAGFESLAFSPNGTRLAAGSPDGTVTLWNLADGSARTIGAGHTGSVTSVAFSPDGRLLTTGSADVTVKLWQVADGRELMTFEGHAESVQSVAFSPDGTLVASGSLDDTVKLWQVADGQELSTLQGHTDSVRSVAFSPDGTRLASGSHDQTVILWEIPEGRVWQTFQGHKAGILSVAFSPDGRLLASGSVDQSIKFWQVADDQGLTTTLHGHIFGVRSIAFSPDGTRLASGSDDKTIKVWNVADGRELITFQGHSNPVERVIFSPDGTLLASGSTDGIIKLRQVADGRELLTFRGLTGKGDDLPDADGKIKPWHNTVPGDPERPVRTDSIAFSPDGSLVALCSLDGTIKLWQVADGRELLTFEGHTGTVNSVAFSPDSTLLASGSDDQTIKLWNVADGRELATLHGHTDVVRSVAFNPDGTLLASGSYDGTAKLWEVADGRERLTFHGHTSDVLSVAFSPDGTRLATGSGDTTIKFWQIADGREFATFPGHASVINTVVFSPDGTLLASGSYDRTIKLWHLDLEEYLIPGCEWLQGYLKTNPNVSEADRGVCGEMIENVSKVN